MTTYRVSYSVEHVGKQVGMFGPELTARSSHHVVLVGAPSRVHAFAATFDWLCKEGIALSTDLEKPYKEGTLYVGVSEEEAARLRLLNELDFTDEDLDLLQDLGVPLMSEKRAATVTEIAPHAVNLEGCAVREVAPPGSRASRDAAPG